ncbi:hypothetical protein EOA29_37840 [Mesorhizobium sp. M1E.F.Ca.ET.063.01.1.1]|nr:hypothetical protein EOA29_37840 [Mesorhizobium sp. M1E.F.Ca.ET.063.01.1.1]
MSQESRPNAERLEGQHPPLSCRTSPPQGGRLAVARAALSASITPSSKTPSSAPGPSPAWCCIRSRRDCR